MGIFFGFVEIELLCLIADCSLPDSELKPILDQKGQNISQESKKILVLSSEGFVSETCQQLELMKKFENAPNSENFMSTFTQCNPH